MEGIQIQNQSMYKLRVMQVELEVINIFARIVRDGIARGTFKKIDVDVMAYNILMMAHTWS